MAISAADYERLHRLAQELGARLEQQNAKVQELQAELDRRAKELRHKTQELEITADALRKQSKHQKELETELVFTRSALAEERARLAENPEEVTWQERYIRLQAEFDNVRKRWEQRSIAESAENRRQVLADMLPLADHLDLALQHQPARENDVQIRNFVNNIEATRRSFLDTLRRYGVERIDAVNEPFDPSRHEAIGHIPSDTAPADYVAVVTQAGYSEGDRLLRPARVLISGGPATV